MTRVRVDSFTISLDGYGAGPNQDINNPLGVGGTDLHQWLIPTRTMQRNVFGKDGGTTGMDEAWLQERWCVDSGKEHVRTDSGPLAGHELERLVGGRATVSRSGLHPDASCTPNHRDGRRHDVSLHHGGHSRGA